MDVCFAYLPSGDKIGPRVAALASGFDNMVGILGSITTLSIDRQPPFETETYERTSKRAAHAVPSEMRSNKSRIYIYNHIG